eukprot:m.77600 g.77600  ORF g.77600 m.77600 type:complete len:593 (+) comp17301_c0_seq1:380-2158(+)
MLPFFGGYPDNFWSKDHQDHTTYASWMFSPRAPALPDGFPLLDVEMGGGMASCYAQRVHMEAFDMPSFHLTFLASGSSCLGFYMYHGGNNPHSLLFKHDYPNETLQESSFQPAGAQNPMPSESYDFFAPLGEFGQARPHYHRMRLLHLFLQSFGLWLAPRIASVPSVAPADYTDVATLRFAVRSDEGSGLLFVNNYQRWTSMPAKSNVRFELRSPTAANISTLTIPSPASAALTVPADSFFVLPFRLPLTGDVQLAWATAQVVSQLVTVSVTRETVVLVEVAGLPVELAVLGSANLTVVSHTGPIVSEGDHWVLRNPTLGTTPVLVLRNTLPERTVLVEFVVLPARYTDAVWAPEEFANQRHVVLSENATFVLSNGSSLLVRSPSQADSVTLTVAPVPGPLTLSDGTVLKPTLSGSFGQYTVPRPAGSAGSAPTVHTRLVRAAGPPRTVPTPHGYGQEPTEDEWLAGAAVYEVTLSALPPNSTHTLLHVDYLGDAARFFFGTRLLTDNWYSGYQGQGAMEIGITALSGENDFGPVGSPVTFTLQILPLTRAALQKAVYLPEPYQPPFDARGIALALNSVSVSQMWEATLSLP